MKVKQQIREWWDNSHHDYDNIPEHRVHSKEEKEIWRDALTKSFGTTQRLKVLDMGTGTGFLALLLAEMGHDVTGADWSKSKLNEANEKIKNSDIPVEFVIGDAEDLSFEDGLFDAVVSRHLIWTLADPATAFREWARVVTPGGRVITDVPGKHHHPGSHHFGEEIGRELPFYNGADPVEIVRMFEAVGLINSSVRRFDELTLVAGERL
ncbi:MAG: methyltransferase domain-containing protein [Euryarchaeota archaeon]|nr:methyltransferase domain-containing protein [Euryarchaeota archaeon]